MKKSLILLLALTSANLTQASETHSTHHLRPKRPYAITIFPVSDCTLSLDPDDTIRLQYFYIQKCWPHPIYITKFGHNGTISYSFPECMNMAQRAAFAQHLIHVMASKEPELLAMGKAALYKY